MCRLVFTPAVIIFVRFSETLQINVASSVLASLNQGADLMPQRREVRSLVGLSVPAPGDDPE